MIRKKTNQGQTRGPSKDKKNKNPFLNSKGGINLIENFVGIDFMPYESKKKRKDKRR